ncbi:hypothetical protein [Paenibacillus sp. 481]|uniref:hypothetical protein n=1 Tax=Paenibacillus sp. 481 TaxID=2835869 RepID=UPI001E2A98BA|nr:hypothetical protein [Paenibacillus sp. 481]UHA73555.1 hypothetical protein KIK04_23910 [Paenibacillus sp. 481]
MYKHHNKLAHHAVKNEYPDTEVLVSTEVSPIASLGAKMLSNLTLHSEFNRYVDAMHAILTHKGWISCPKYMLAGMTALCFRFTVQRQLDSVSTTAYNWMAEHFLAADFIGISASQDAGFHFMATFPLYQQQGINEIKASINDGTGVILWKDAFVVVTGYDDSRAELYYCDGTEAALSEPAEHLKHMKAIPYAQLGYNDSPYWYFQSFGERSNELDELSVYKESFLQAIYVWETHDPMLPEDEYACGQQAYDAIVKALQTGDYDQEAAREVVRYYAAAKKDIALYTTALQSIWPNLQPVAAQYAKVAQYFAQATAVLRGTHEQVTDSQQLLVSWFEEAKAAEGQAIQMLKERLLETVHNRFNHVGLR